MQKKLSDYFRTLLELDQGRLLEEFYETQALLRSDESAAVVSGMLLSLNVVDCNLCVKVRPLIMVYMWSSFSNVCVLWSVWKGLKTGVTMI